LIYARGGGASPHVARPVMASPPPRMALISGRHFGSHLISCRLKKKPVAPTIDRERFDQAQVQMVGVERVCDIRKRLVPTGRIKRVVVGRSAVPAGRANSTREATRLEIRRAEHIAPAGTEGSCGRNWHAVASPFRNPACRRRECDSRTNAGCSRRKRLRLSGPARADSAACPTRLDRKYPDRPP
jgi:hypothetical protein